MYGVNVTTGYFAMLVAMTYSVELFSCMIIGLVLGHALFNSGQYPNIYCILSGTFNICLEAAVGESVDPCCASQTIAASQESSEDTKIIAAFQESSEDKM